jgi:hypothetical protein
MRGPARQGVDLLAANAGEEGLVVGDRYEERDMYLSDQDERKPALLL